MCENSWSTPLVTIHRRLENYKVGMQFMRNLLSKTPCNLCRSRGIRDLQLSLLPLGALFSSKMWRKDWSNRATPTPEHAGTRDVARRHTEPAVVHACAHAEVMKGPPVQGGCDVSTVLWGEVTHAVLGWCHAPSPHASHGHTAPPLDIARARRLRWCPCRAPCRDLLFDDFVTPSPRHAYLVRLTALPRARAPSSVAATIAATDELPASLDPGAVRAS
jgi:hypothetical protein